MLKRLILLTASVLFAILALESIFARLESYCQMHVEKAGGRPYLLLETCSGPPEPERRFSVFSPSNNNLDHWTPLITDLRGPAHGLFVFRPSPPEGESGLLPQRLGIFHTGRIATVDLTEQPAYVRVELLPFDWPPETAVEFKDAIYAFGVEVKSDSGEGAHKGELKVARYDGRKWEPLPLTGPQLSLGRTGFYLKALVTGEHIKVLCRPYVQDQTLDPLVEGLRFSMMGPLAVATFDGEAFKPDLLEISSLPRGNLSAWAAGDDVKLLIQTRLKPKSSGAERGPLEIWRLSAGVQPEKIETIQSPPSRTSLFPPIAAEYIAWQGQEFIVRSNWQTFEIWRKTDGATWTLISTNPGGLCTYDMENVLLLMLAGCLAVIALGAGLVLRRRKQALLLLSRTRPELQAPLILRAGAWALDLGAVLLVALTLRRLLEGQWGSPFTILPFSLTQMPDWPYVMVYGTYMVLTEWLAQASPGKYLLGLRVINDDGGRPSCWAVLVRNFVGFYERIPPLAFVTLPIVALTPRRQRLGDLLARTLVVQQSALEYLVEDEEVLIPPEMCRESRGK